MVDCEQTTDKQRMRCAVTTPHGFYIDSENCGLDWTFGAEDEATRLSPKHAERTAMILNRLGISAAVKTYE
jgi:hypothetical protein